MKRPPIANRIAFIVDVVEQTVAVIVIRVVGILGALTFLAVAFYECACLIRDIWLARQ